MDVAVPRRACLSVPGSSARMLSKARSLRVDEVVLDLEDAVRPEDKAAARRHVVEALADETWLPRTVAVRVNAPGTPWCHEDLVAFAAAGPVLGSVILPKVESTGDIAFAATLLDGAEAASGRPTPLGLQALVETSRGVLAIEAIAGASPRLASLILGYADLAASLGRHTEAAQTPGRWLVVQEAVLLAARAHGLQAIDGPWLGTAVDDAFVAAVEHAAALGFDGKWAIHPRQVPTLITAFTPAVEDVDRARAVLDALAGAHRGAVALDGQMLDEAVAVAARRVLARAGAVGA